jgi:hypothetical protein
MANERVTQSQVDDVVARLDNLLTESNEISLADASAHFGADEQPILEAIFARVAGADEDVQGFDVLNMMIDKAGAELSKWTCTSTPPQQVTPTVHFDGGTVCIRKT